MRKLLFVSLIASVAFMSSCQKEEFSSQSLAAAAVGGGGFFYGLSPIVCAQYTYFG